MKKKWKLWKCTFWVTKKLLRIKCTYVRRRRTSILPEIRVLAPSLERGLDDSWPLSQSPEIPQSPSSLTNSPCIYRSHDDITSESSRYISVYSKGTKVEHPLQSICTRSVSIAHKHIWHENLYSILRSCCLFLRYFSHHIYWHFCTWCTLVSFFQYLTSTI